MGSSLANRLRNLLLLGAGFACDAAIICAEGYLFELERRGYVQIGPFVPEVVVSDPEVVKQLHREFVRAGSDVVEAFTYYGHRTKLRLIGKEHLVENLNRTALKIAREIVDEFPEKNLLLAGNISNTTVYDPDNAESLKEIRAMFAEQLTWAKEANVDYIIAETFSHLGEAEIALEMINQFGFPAVVTMAIHTTGKTEEGISILESFERLSAKGAAVVGLNCSRGPKTIISLLKEVTGKIKTPLACLPVGYSTNDQFPTFQSFSTRDRKYTDLDGHTCTRYEFGDFAKEAVALGVKYIGTCCGAGPHHVRAIAEALGRKPISSQFSANLSLHFAFGHKTSLTNTSEGTIEKNFNYGEKM
jgi:betaine-homocysteine S-methyltransferase